ncbi:MULTISPECIES: DUF4153 domain-containing protein [Pseudomonas]|uniref:DUF4153 domain-containing protein n=1 Tax=Pseudomonas cichorii TaxID=36746 RepID=A0A3M4WC79_PSECI|nr:MULTISPECIES: DUF4153 domain-containing protein [Pseudomonas]AHF69862.1 hypothetical protein PCH70_47090 [Pseudomonas cichorii JBC1]QVE16768.1 DUF4153 domain-containing protein [Pseudomonas cichorii]RMR61655.1 hypothetical protein ALP84_05236 [Pseudomonas cichorii]SDP06000.1 protein of unknown function [Pseudomonas cichorii]GFM78672.1 hypothetical protein PSCICM_44910 [Pseudomonas cichorii]
MSVLKGSLPFYIVVGLVQAVIMVVAWKHDKTAVFVAALVFGVNLQLLGSNFRQRGAWVLAGLLALLLAMVTEWALQRALRSWDENWIFCSVIVGYICSAFIQSWPSGNRLHLLYRSLFQHAWNDGLIVLLALLLAGLFWSLLQLCASLFHMIGIEVFKEVIKTRNFNIVSLCMVFSLGIRIGRQNDKVIGMLRGILLSLCRFLAPLTAFIVVLFTLTLPFTGLESIWNTGRATTILLCLVAANVFLVNGVFQDGSQSHDYPQGLKWLINASLLLLPVLAALACYSIWLRIEQYGLSPSRVIGLLLVVIAALYSLAAFIAVLRSGDVWLGNLRFTNPWLALLACVMTVTIHTPWWNPEELSARNQIQRLMDGTTPPALFDADHLLNWLGKPGLRAFDRLKADLDHLPQNMDANAREVLKLRVYDAWARSQGRYRAFSVPEQNLVWIGERVDGYEQFTDSRLGSRNCNRVQCTMWVVDLDSDGQNEVVQLVSTDVWMSFFKRDTDGQWKEVGRMHGPFHKGKDLADLIRAGKARLVEPRYRTLDIDGLLYTPVENR